MTNNLNSKNYKSLKNIIDDNGDISKLVNELRKY